MSYLGWVFHFLRNCTLTNKENYVIIRKTRKGVVSMKPTSFKPKRVLTKEEQGSLLRTSVVNLVHRHAIFEGVGITLPQTHEILTGFRSAGISEFDTVLVLNLKKALDWVSEPYESGELGYLDLATVHRILTYGLVPTEYCGNIRNQSVRITGTSYVPPMPSRLEIDNTMRNMVYLSNSPVEFALDLFCYIARTQAFIDGNKRTAFMIANKVLNQYHLGYLKPSTSPIFREKLVRFYETNNPEELKKYLYAYCLKTR